MNELTDLIIVALLDEESPPFTYFDAQRAAERVVRILSAERATQSEAGLDVDIRKAATELVSTWDRVALAAVREGWPAMPQDFGSVADAVKALRTACAKGAGRGREPSEKGRKAGLPTVERLARAIHTSNDHNDRPGCLDMDRDSAVALRAALAATPKEPAERATGPTSPAFRIER